MTGRDLDWLEGGHVGSPRCRSAGLPRSLSPVKLRRRANAREAPKSKSHGTREGALTSESKGRKLLVKSLRDFASRKTLAEAIAAGSWQVAVWRGTSTLQSVHCAAMQSAEMGRHFRACELAKAAEDRARAADWAARRQRRGAGKVNETSHYQKEGTESMLVKDPTCLLCNAALPECECIKPSPSVPMEKERSGQEREVSKQTSLQNATRRASLARRLSCVGRRQSADLDPSAVQRQATERRKSNEKQKKIPTFTRLQRLIQAKQMEFEAFPEEQKQRLRDAFDRAVGDLRLSELSDGFFPVL